MWAPGSFRLHSSESDPFGGEFIRRGPGQSSDLTEIGPNREESAIPRDDQRLRPACQFIQSLRERQHTRTCQAIRTVLGSQTQHANVVMLFEMKQLGSWHLAFSTWLPKFEKMLRANC
jgi:hypothetical protein